NQTINIAARATIAARTAHPIARATAQAAVEAAMNGKPSLATGHPCARSAMASVLGFVDELILLEPRHHRPQTSAHLLNRMFLAAFEQRVVLRPIRLALQDPFLREAPALDLVQDALHLLLRL